MKNNIILYRYPGKMSHLKDVPEGKISCPLISDPIGWASPKIESEFIKLFIFSIQLSRKFTLLCQHLLAFTMPTSVGILI